MNIVILGAGDIGAHISSLLSHEEHNVILIDKDPKRLEKISREIDVATVHGYGSNWNLLDDLMEYEPDFFIALTGDDETNLISCSMAKNLGYPKTITRIKEVRYLTRSRLDFGRLFFVDYFIGAEVLAAHEILKNVINPTSDITTETFAHGAIQMHTVSIPKNWEKVGVAISKLTLPEELIIALIRRYVHENGKTHEQIIIPHGEDTLQPGDEVTVVGETKVMFNLNSIFGTQKKIIKSVVIIGGSEVGLHLARMLEKQGIKIKIIEMDDKRCELLAEHLPNSTIINHDGRDLNYLLAEKVANAGAFIACTKKDEQNFLIAALGKQAGSQKVIAMISNAHLGPSLKELDIDFSISEKVNLGNRILSIVHAESIISIASLCDDQAKVLEMKVSPDSKLVGIPLSDLSSHLPKDFLIAVIENRGKVMIGRGNRILSPNDTVIVISSPRHIHEFQHLF